MEPEVEIKINLETLLDGNPIELEFVRQAIAEKIERDKGCEYCYGSNAPFYQVSTNSEPTLKMFTPKFCPMCGKVWGEYETT